MQNCVCVCAKKPWSCACQQNVGSCCWKTRRLTIDLCLGPSPPAHSVGSGCFWLLEFHSGLECFLDAREHWRNACLLGEFRQEQCPLHQKTAVSAAGFGRPSELSDETTACECNACVNVCVCVCVRLQLTLTGSENSHVGVCPRLGGGGL